MSQDSIRGKTIRFTFHDGPMAKKTFEHRFDRNGTVAFHEIGKETSASETKPSDNPATRYEFAAVRDGVFAVSYLSSAGYTLTAVLDDATKKLVAFSSNEKMLGIQHGSFEEVGPATDAAPKVGRPEKPVRRGADRVT